MMAGGVLEAQVRHTRERVEEIRRLGPRVPRKLIPALQELAHALDEFEKQEPGESAVSRDRHYEDLFELAPDIYLVTDADGCLREANSVAKDRLGLPAATSAGLPMPVLFDAAGRRELYHVLEAASRGDVVRGWEVTLHPRRKPPVVAAVHCAPKLDMQRRVAALRWLIHDVGPLVEAREHEVAALNQARRRLDELNLLQEATAAVAGVLDPSSVLSTIVEYAARIRGSRGGAAVVQVTGGTAHIVAHHDPAGKVDLRGRSLFVAPPETLPEDLGCAAARPWQPEHVSESVREFLRELGRVQLATVAIPHGADGLQLLVLGATDSDPFSEEELAMLASLAQIAVIGLRNADTYQQQAWLASTDPLTGLPNLRQFERLLAVPQERGLAVLAMDVDNLKAINDSYGHAAGDLALVAVADCLRACLREGDVAARTGGDEFSAILYGATRREAQAVGSRLRDTMHHVTLPQGELRVSVGMAVAPTCSDVNRARKAADRALYTAKESGRDRVVTLSASDAGAGHRRRHPVWEQTVAGVLGGRGLYPVYQPMVDLGESRVAGYEALVRPHGAAAGMSASEMFAAARTMGRQRDLEWLARRTALEGARELPGGVPLFVKAGLILLLDELLDVDQLQLLLTWSGRAPQDLVLELSEREAVRDPGRFEALLATYRAAGIRFAVEHLGEGCQTIGGLMRAAPEFVKLSPCLLRVSRRTTELSAAVAFASALGATVIVPGIETADELRTATDLGVQLAQGFFLGRPSRRFATPPIARLLASG